MFPEIGLPDRVTVARYTASGVDADDNTTYTTTFPILRRPARFYRDSAKDSKYVKDGFTLKGVVAFKYHSGDTILDADEIRIVNRDSTADETVPGPEFADIGEVLQVVYASLKMSWKKPSHWEIALGVQA